MIVRDGRRVEHNLGPRPAGSAPLSAQGITSIFDGEAHSKRLRHEDASAYGAGMGRDSLASAGAQGVRK